MKKKVKKKLTSRVFLTKYFPQNVSTWLNKKNSVLKVAKRLKESRNE